MALRHVLMDFLFLPYTGFIYLGLRPWVQEQGASIHELGTRALEARIVARAWPSREMSTSWVFMKRGL